MEKLRHEISSMVDEIPVPDQKLNETVQTALIKAKKQEKSSHFKIQSFIATIASVIVVAFGVLLLNSYQETAGGDNTDNSSILYQQGDVGLKRMVTEGHTQEIGMEADEHGIKVILEEGYLDNHKMVISLRMETEKEIDTLPEKTDLVYDLFIDGISQGHTGWDGIDTHDLVENGIVFDFSGEVEDITPNSSIKFEITKINDVEGDWSFQFELDKEKEYLVKSDFPGKQDELGNSLFVRNVELSPSTLRVAIDTKLLVNDQESGFEHFEIDVIGMGPDGEMYLPESYRFYNDYNPEFNNVVEKYHYVIEIPRGVNVYSYKVIPYIATYQGEEVPVEHGEAYDWYKHTAPFAEGEIIGSNSEVKVEGIKQEKNATIVTYEIDTSLPVFPKIINQENDEYIYAVSFKNIGDKVKVTYPKVTVDKKTKFMLYDTSYQVFPELETQIDLR